MDFSHWGEPSREWEAFAAHNAAAIIVAPIPGTIEQLKEQANKARTERGRMHLRDEGLEDKFVTTDHEVPTRDGESITLRAYRPAEVSPDEPLPAYVYFHGGGFLFGCLDGETYVCAMLSHRLRCAVLHICYRHTPEYTHPTAHHDAWDGFEWVMSHGASTPGIRIDLSRVIVGGISAGGQLAASVAYREVQEARSRRSSSPPSSSSSSSGNSSSSNKNRQQRSKGERERRERPRLRGQVLSIPWLCHRDAYPYHLFRDRSRASSQQCMWAPVIPKPRADLFTDLLRVPDVKGRLWNLAQAEEDELRGTVRTALVSSGMDVVRDEGLLYVLKLESLKTPTKVHIFPGLPHAFYMFSELPSRMRYHEAVIECAKWAFSDDPGPKKWIVEPPPEEYDDE